MSCASSNCLTGCFKHAVVMCGNVANRDGLLLTFQAAGGPQRPGQTGLVTSRMHGMTRLRVDVYSVDRMVCD